MSEETFDRIASRYDEALPAHVVEHYLEKRARYVLSRCGTGTGLDVGCGTGALAGRLARAGWRMTGIDPSQGMLEVLARRAPEVEAVRGSGAELPFDDDSFDLVLSVATLHHIAAPAAVRATLGEMVRVCRPDGKVLVWDHNPRNPYWHRLMAKVPQDDGSERLIGETELVEGLRAAGAKPISVQQLGLVPEFIPPALLGLTVAGERLAERLPGVRRLCAHNVVLAEPG
jgi:ubiquinone/menaquinone biosynthesis C-methylase UbiE